MTKTWKKVTAFLLGLVMLGGAVGGGAFANSWRGGVELDAAEQKITIAAADFGLGDGAAISNANVKGIIFDGAKGTHTNSSPSYWTSDSTVRMYKGNTFSITSTIGKMTSITMTFERGGSYISISSGNATYSNPTITSNDAGGMESVSLSITGTLRIESFVIVVTSEDITLDNLYVIGEETFTIFDVLTTEDFVLDGTKSDDTEVTFEDVTAQIGHDTEFRPIEWGVTQPLVTDTTVRFTSLLPNKSGEYETCDVTIVVSEPVITEIVISGDIVTKEYAVGSLWDPTGLTVTGTLSPEGTINLTNEVVWSYDPATAELGTTEVKVTATYNELVANITVTGITVVHEITDTITGNNVPTGSGYGSWTYSGSTAQYSILSNRSQNYIQIRTDNSNSGIVSTLSGGKIKSITIEWASNTAAGRELGIYASNSPYSAPSDLYGGTNPVTTLNKGNNETTYTFTDEYSYVGVRSEDGALYLNSITFVWQADVITTVESVEVVGTMNKTEYYTNEEWKADGLSVNLHYSDGEVSNITSGYTLTWDPATPTLGTEQVSVIATYNNVTSEPVTFNVTVQEYVAPVYSFHPTTDPEGFTGSAGSFTGEGLGWDFYMTGTEAATSAFDDTKGLHFGTGSKPAETVTLYSDVFAASTGETMINRIVVNASSANGNDGSAKMDVKINNAVVGSVTLTRDATDYSFVLPTPAWGVVEIVLTNGGSKAAMYIGGVDIYAEADETITTEVVAAINALTDFRTCDITQGHEAFGTFLTTHASVLDTLRGMNEVYVHDYENDAYANEVYVDGALKTRIITVAEKLAACEARYQVGAQVNAPFVFGNNDTTLMVVIIVIALASVSSLIGFRYYDKKRRVNK